MTDWTFGPSPTGDQIHAIDPDAAETACGRDATGWQSGVDPSQVSRADLCDNCIHGIDFDTLFQLQRP